MGIKDRREKEKLDRRNSILQAAQGLFGDRGYEATMDEIAEKAELSKPTLYLYFSNKDDLYASIALDGFRDLKELFKEVVESDAGTEDKVRSLYHTFIAFNIQHKQVSRITEFVLSERGRERVPIELSERINTDIADLLGYASSVLKQGMDEGIYSEGDPLTISIVVWRSLLGLLSLAVEDALPDHGPGYYDHLFESALVVLTEGIRKR
jgi:AcrR family transcriptional regulator